MSEDRFTRMGWYGILLIALVAVGTMARLVYLEATTPSPLTCDPHKG